MLFGDHRGDRLEMVMNSVQGHAVITVFVLGAILMIALGTRSPAQNAPRCEADKARFAVGEILSPELAERAARAAGARSTRKIEPDGAATMDLQPDRLNLEVDSRNIIQRVTCG
jgi:Peptidase inhibitor I78 family